MRGQVTGFAIVGVLLLIGVLAIVWVSRAPNTQTEPQRPTLDLESCIEDTSLDAISAVSLAGGVHPDDALVVDPITLNGFDGDLHVWPALVAWEYGEGPAHIPGSDHVFEADMQTATNVFPRFGRTSTAITTLIEQNVEDCETTPDENIEVTSVEYSDTSVRVESRASQPGRSPRDVTVTVPVPIRSYHRLLVSAIDGDNRDPTFEFSSRVSDGFSLITIPTENDDNDTILMLRSDRPLIGSEPFTFLTLIQERAPVFVDQGPNGCSDPDLEFPAGISIDDAYVDFDDDHEPTAECTTLDPDRIEITLNSAGNTYTLEVSP